MLNKRPHLFFDHPELIHYSNLSYQVHTSAGILGHKEFKKLLDNYFNAFDKNWVLKMYPRTYQSLIAIQVKFYNSSEGIRFSDAPRPLGPSVEQGLRDLIPEIQQAREQVRKEDPTGRPYGMSSEALCHQYLQGSHQNKAVQLLQNMLTLEQQSQDTRIKHVIYYNLCQCHFLNRQWDEMIETRKKYLRLVESDGEFDNTLSGLMNFQFLISRVMLGEMQLTATELEKKCKDIFGEDQQGYDDWVGHTLDHLGLSEKKINPTRPQKAEGREVGTLLDSESQN